MVEEAGGASVTVLAAASCVGGSAVVPLADAVSVGGGATALLVGTWLAVWGMEASAVMAALTARGFGSPLAHAVTTIRTMQSINGFMAWAPLMVYTSSGLDDSDW